MVKHLAKVHSDKVTEIVLGEGRVVVGHTSDYKGNLPALTFSLAPRLGKPGEDFVPEGTYHLAEGSVVLVFLNMAAVLQHMDRLKMLVDEIASKGIE